MVKAWVYLEVHLLILKVNIFLIQVNGPMSVYTVVVHQRAPEATGVLLDAGGADAIFNCFISALVDMLALLFCWNSRQ